MFHVQNGLFFDRVGDEVYIYSPTGGTETLTAEVWASVVASMGAGGESGASYTQALADFRGE